MGPAITTAYSFAPYFLSTDSGPGKVPGLEELTSLCRRQEIKSKTILEGSATVTRGQGEVIQCKHVHGRSFSQCDVCPETHLFSHVKTREEFQAVGTARDKVLGQNEYSDSRKCQKSSRGPTAVSVGAEQGAVRGQQGTEMFLPAQGPSSPLELHQEASHAQLPSLLDFMTWPFPPPSSLPG